MFTHSVYFWLRPDLAPNERAKFLAGVRSLLGISSVRHAFYGAPADTDRPVIERSYSYGMVVVFDDVAGHDAYQVDPVHDRFRAECSPFWARVQIFDFETPPHT